MDVVTTGNHELYINTTSSTEYEDVVPEYKDAYIASNLDFRSPKDSGKLVPFAPRYRIFKTKNQGLRILAFGFLFNFHGNANNTVVQPVEDTVKEDWFHDAIREKDVDLFVVAGHVPVRNSPEFDVVYKAIRDVKWDTPIVFFGGHTHIRDYRTWEKKAYGIESGRYMETLGFLSISGLGSESKTEDDGGVTIEASTPKYERLYIDNNLFSMHHHSGTNKSTFDTDLGRNVSTSIHYARSKLDLDHTFGCAPHTYWLNRAAYPSSNSLLTWLEEKVLPDTFTNSNSSANPSVVLTNSGALRFDIFKGPFTTDTTFLVCPFTSGFRMIRNVPFKAASQVLRTLNNEGPIPLKDLLGFVKGEGGWGEHRLDDLVPPVSQRSLVEREAIGFAGQGQQQQVPLEKDDPQVPGYTTKDDAGSDGDDTLHQRIKFYSVPNCVGSNIGFKDDDEPETVDLVYNEFIQDWVLLALRYLGVRYGVENTRIAADGTTMTDVIRGWVGEKWKCDE